MVVMIHAHMTINVCVGAELTKWGGVGVGDLIDYPVYANLSFVISEILSRTALPLFFFIAGYLFFYNRTEHFCGKDYLYKLQRRTYSLLIPYIIWNALVIVAFWAVQTIMPQLTSGENKFVSDWSFKDWMSAFWAYDNGHPINGPFWFIRDLMVVSLFSPAIYWMVKGRKGLFGVSLLFLLWIYGWYPGIPGFNTDAFFLFALGACCSVNHKDVVELCNICFVPAIIISLASISLQIWAFNKGELGCSLMDTVVYTFLRLGSLSLMLVLITTTNLIMKKCHKSLFLRDSNFFIFAYHMVTLGFVSKVISKIFVPMNDLQAIVVYIFQPSLVIGIGLLLYYFLQRWFPSFTKMIIGNRI